jgi:virulence-associated protein VapD
LIAVLTSLGFQNIQGDAYWSSSENRYFAAEARVVNMTDGTASFADKTLYFNLWPVRSAR